MTGAFPLHLTELEQRVAVLQLSIQGLRRPKPPPSRVVFTVTSSAFPSQNLCGLLPKT
jgi:hypothetical protein